MKTLSIILGILAMINLFLIITTTTHKLDLGFKYIFYGCAYAAMHLIYQAIMKEGIFKR